MIPLQALVLSQMNPRRTFNEASINELAESILQVGVLSPVIVRPMKRGFELICGARRFKASIKAGVPDIPAIVRELTDNEALELMITENLQRKDVSPLEEAEAFQNLITHRQYDVHALVTRFGKSEFYIRMRLKLNDLIPEFRELLTSEHIGVSHAMELCKLDAQYQKELYKAQFSGYATLFWSCPSVKVLKRNIENNFTLKLDNAPFPLDDNTLDAKAGACTTCPQNTASNQLLFPDIKGTGVCLNRECFRQKSDTLFLRKLTWIQEEEPGILLGYLPHIYGEDQKELERLMKSGVEAVELSYRNFDTINQPDKPEAPDAEDYDNPDDYEEAMQEHLQELQVFELDLATYEQEIKEPGVRKVFIVAGSSKGSYQYVRTRESGDDSQDNSPERLITNQINELREKDKRNQELEREKNYEAAKQLTAESYVKITTDITPAETQALLSLMMEALEEDLVQELAALHDNRKEATEYRYINRKARHAIAGQVMQKHQDLGARVMRSFLRHNCQTGNPSYEVNKAEALISIAAERFPEEMGKAQEENRNKYLKRKASIEKQIRQLEKTAAEVEEPVAAEV
jgi:ParB family transcriptional regulator, chromosome partitioning protein